MADLTGKDASQSVILAGAGPSSGIETNYVDVNANGNLSTQDIVNTSGVYGALTVGTTAVEARVGGSPLANRKGLIVHNNSNRIMYWGYDSSVTTSNGIPIFPGSAASWSIGPSLSIYLITDNPGQNARIAESA